jgi:hypothetical protein
VGKNERKETPCILQVAELAKTDGLSPRSMKNARLHVENAATVAEHAAAFNRLMIQGDDSNFPTIKVCAPVACEVLTTMYADILPRGAACTITPYDETEVHKFVFDGRTDKYLAVAQTFFHYVGFATQGENVVADLQGQSYPDGSVKLVDPVVMDVEMSEQLPKFRARPESVLGMRSAGDEMLEMSLPIFASSAREERMRERFNTLHPKCSRMCRVFDPQRHGLMGRQKGSCGVKLHGIYNMMSIARN